MIPTFVSFELIDMDIANKCLVKWGHLMGPLKRPMGNGFAHGLFHEGRPVAIITTSSLISARVAGLSRDDAIEVSRVCAEKKDICRVVIRLWREFVFPYLGKTWAISYQDAVAHRGDLYRFDGWTRLNTSQSGTDRRSGRKGRKKVIWSYQIQTPITRFKP